MNSFVITIDGPAGVGKSSTARLLARKLDMAYLDTGAMYRVVGQRLGEGAADLPEAEVRRLCLGLRFELRRHGHAWELFCDAQPLGQDIRGEEAGRLASLVAKLPVVRECLHQAQRNLAQDHPLVAEGRDMGTRVFPDAPCKFFLDAAPQVRAERRYKEMLSRGDTSRSQAQVLTAILQRDDQDRKRSLDPLHPAADAILVDTSALSPEQVLAELESQALARRPLDLSHVNSHGEINMVDVGDKPSTLRIARAAGFVEMNAHTLELLLRRALPKGDVLVTAKVAGILAAKQVAQLIPLCHPLSLSYADVSFTVSQDPPGIALEAETRTTGPTGVEMEAIVAVQMAAATIYDMAKAVQKDMVIRDVRLIYKSGGKSGVFQRD